LVDIGIAHGSFRSHQSAALQYTTPGIRVNTVAPGLVRTPTAERILAQGQQGVRKMKITRAVVATTLVVLSGGAQQRSEDAVLAVYGRLERADRDGDLLAWLRLQDRKTREETGASVTVRASKGGLRSTPTLRYQSIAVRTLDGRAVVAGNIIGAAQNSSNPHLIEFVLEEGEWKVATELLSDTPFDRSVIYAVLPPPDGSYAWHV
jgi:hypothetical protein